MTLFRPRRPRPFHYEYLYSDERTAHIAETDRQIAGGAANGADAEKGFRAERIRGTYVEASRHLRRRNERSNKWQTKGTVVKVIVIVLLILIWAYLL